MSEEKTFKEALSEFCEIERRKLESQIEQKADDLSSVLRTVAVWIDRWNQNPGRIPGVTESEIDEVGYRLQRSIFSPIDKISIDFGKKFFMDIADREIFEKLESGSKIRSIQVSYPHLSQFHETLRDLDEKERAEVVFKTEIHFGVEFEFLSKEDMEAIEAEVLEGPNEHPGWTSFSEEMGHKPGVQVRLTFGVLGHSPAEKWLRAFLLERYPGPLTYKVYGRDKPIE